MTDYPPELRQQIIEAAMKATLAGEGARPRYERIADAILPIIAREIWIRDQALDRMESTLQDAIDQRVDALKYAEKAESERDELRDEREDSLSRWHQIAESEADVKRLTEERDAALERIATAEKDADEVERLEAERDELLAAAAVFKAQRDALLPLVRWLKEELEQAAIRAHPRLIYADRYALEDLPDDLRATLDAALTETPNE